MFAGFAMGAIAGSFIGLLYVRLPQRRGIVGGRSRCDQCGRALKPAELLPLVSYLWLRGRCRACGGRIAPSLWFVELVAAVIGAFAATFARQPVDLLWAVFGWTLLFLAALDLRHYWLPNAVTAFLAAAGIATVVVSRGDVLASAIGGFAGFAGLEAVRRGYRWLRGRDGMGAGDPKLLGAIGIWTGWQALPFVLVGGSLVGLAVVMILKLRGEPVTAATRVPLGACLAVAAMLLWFAAAVNPLVALAAL